MGLGVDVDGACGEPQPDRFQVVFGVQRIVAASVGAECARQGRRERKLLHGFHRHKGGFGRDVRFFQRFGCIAGRIENRGDFSDVGTGISQPIDERDGVFAGKPQKTPIPVAAHVGDAFIEIIRGGNPHFGQGRERAGGERRREHFG